MDHDQATFVWTLCLEFSIKVAVIMPNYRIANVCWLPKISRVGWWCTLIRGIFIRMVDIAPVNVILDGICDCELDEFSSESNSFY